jgi:hypothetical protein
MSLAAIRTLGGGQPELGFEPEFRARTYTVDAATGALEHELVMPPYEGVPTLELYGERGRDASSATGGSGVAAKIELSYASGTALRVHLGSILTGGLGAPGGSAGNNGAAGGAAAFLAVGASSDPTNAAFITPGGGGSAVAKDGGAGSLTGPAADGSTGNERGRGATSSAGGAGGTDRTVHGDAGALHAAGNGGGNFTFTGGGGGGGGYYGGGGGAGGGGGGAGSGGGAVGYVDPALTVVSTATSSLTACRAVLEITERDPLPVAAQLVDAPGGLWPLHESIGGIFYDVSGNDRHLATGVVPVRYNRLQRTIAAPNGSDRFGRGMVQATTSTPTSWSGRVADAPLLVPPSSALPFNGWCAEGFMYRDPGAGSFSSYLFSIGQDTTRQIDVLMDSSGQVQANFRNGGTVVSSTSSSAISSGDWCHILVGIDDTKAFRLYVNGTLVTGWSTPTHAYTPPAATWMAVGSAWQSGVQCGLNALACVAIYDHWWYTTDKVATRMALFGL